MWFYVIEFSSFTLRLCEISYILTNLSDCLILLYSVHKVRRPSEQKVTDDESPAINCILPTRNNKWMFRFFTWSVVSIQLFFLYVHSYVTL